MKPAELKVITEAVRWFKNKKPINETESQHLLNPTINCVTESEKRLARAVAWLMQL